MPVVAATILPRTRHIKELHVNDLGTAGAAEVVPVGLGVIPATLIKATCWFVQWPGRSLDAEPTPSGTRVNGSRGKPAPGVESVGVLLVPICRSRPEGILHITSS